MTLRGPRHTAWGATITRQDGSRATPRITDGLLRWTWDADHMAGGSLTTVGDLGELIGATIEPRVTINGERYGFGSFVATANPGTLGASQEHRVEFIDPSIWLARSRLQQPLSWPRGTHVVRTARQVATQQGLRIDIPDSDVTLRVALAHERRTPWMQALTKLLGAAQLSRPRARAGGLVVERLRAPDELPEEWELAEGPGSVQVLKYGVDSDYLVTPNRLQVETRGDGQVAPLVGTARDEATTRWSYQARGGHWLDEPEALTSEVTTQEAINAEARRLLVERLTRAETLTVSHGWLPEVKAGSVGRFTSQRWPHWSGAWQVASQQVQMQATALATTTLRRVVGL